MDDKSLKEMLGEYKTDDWTNSIEDFRYDELTPITMAKFLVGRYKMKTIYETGVIYYWDERQGRYTDGGELLLRQMLSEKTKDNEKNKTHWQNEIIYHVKTLTAMSINQGQVPDYPYLLAVNNGILNLQTGEFEKNTPNMFITRSIPVSYEPAATCPLFDKYLSEVVEKEDEAVIEEWLGYCLVGHHNIHKALMLLGEGRNGKSTLLNVMGALVGEKNKGHISLQELSTSNWAKGWLRGLMINAHGDIPEKALIDASTFKLLSSGEPVTSDVKHGKPITFKNTCKQAYSANRLPETRDKSDAYFSRWVIISFKHKIPDNKRDEKLTAKLTTPDELSGILNRALRGLQRLEANGRFSYSKSEDEVKQEYLRKSAPLQSFLELECEYDQDARISSTEFYEALVRYCEVNNLPKPNSHNEVSRKIPKLTEGAVYKHRDATGIYWQGIRLKESFQINKKLDIEEVYIKDND